MKGRMFTTTTSQTGGFGATRVIGISESQILTTDDTADRVNTDKADYTDRAVFLRYRRRVTSSHAARLMEKKITMAVA